MKLKDVFENQFDYWVKNKSFASLKTEAEEEIKETPAAPKPKEIETAQPEVRDLTNFRKGDLVKNVQTTMEYEVVTPEKDGKVYLKVRGGKEMISFNARRKLFIPVQKEIKVRGKKRGPIKFKPDSPYGKALNKRTDNFEEAVMQFFIAGGRVRTDDFRRYMGFDPIKEKYLWAIKNDGIHMDVLHEDLSESFKIEEQGTMAEINAICEVLKTYHTKNDMVEELLRRMDQPLKQEMAPEDIIPQMEDDSLENVEEYVPEAVDNLLEEIINSPETMSIFTSRRHEDSNGDIDWAFLRNLAEADPSYFTDGFLFGLNAREFENFKKLLNDTDRQRKIEEKISKYPRFESRGEGDIVRPRAPGDEKRAARREEEKATTIPRKPEVTDLASVKEFYTSAGKPFTFNQFIDREVNELNNYSLKEVREWQKKYDISDNVRVIWVSPNKWIANKYNLPAGEENWEKVPEAELNITPISSNEGFVIPESDDGDGGYLFVFKSAFAGEYIKKKPETPERKPEEEEKSIEDIEYAKRPDGTLKTKKEYTPEEWQKYTASVIDKKLSEMPKQEETPQKQLPTTKTEILVTLGGRTFKDYPLHVYPDGRVDIDHFGRKTLTPDQYKIAFEEEKAEEKRPWEMTQKEYLDSLPEEYVKKEGAINVILQHKKGIVEKALLEGKPVPPEVLKDYPELQKPKIIEPIKPTFVPGKTTGTYTGLDDFMTDYVNQINPSYNIHTMLDLVRGGADKIKGDIERGRYTFDDLKTFYDAARQTDLKEFRDRDYIDRMLGYVKPKEGGKEHAEKVRTETKETGREEELVRGEERPVRVRDLEKDRLEAVKREKEQKEQVALIRRIVDNEEKQAEIEDEIGRIEAKPDDKKTKADLQKLKQLQLAREQLLNTYQSLDKQITDVVNPEQRKQITDLIRNFNADWKVINNRIEVAKADRRAKERELQARPEAFGDRKEAVEKAEGLQTMFAGEIFRPEADLLRAALKPFNDIIEASQKELTRKEDLLNQKIDLVLKGTQKEITFKEPVKPEEDQTQLEKEEKDAPAEEPEKTEDDVRQEQDEFLETESEAKKIEDFGEKIGGARKDISTKGLVEKLRKKEETGLPRWMKNWNLGEQEDGTFRPFKTGDGKWGRMIVFEAKQSYPSEEDALQVIKFAEVAKIFRISQKKDEFVIYRKTGLGIHIVKTGFKTKDDAFKWYVDNTDYLLNYKPEFPERPHLDHIDRTGPEYQKGNVSVDMFADIFGFTGGEFGNWVPQDERQKILNMAYNGLMDLATVLNLPPKALSLNGKLSIAFGARGHGGKVSAAAHYEPDRAVFNLTRIKGAGAVAHEWFHAIDHYFGLQDKGKELEKTEAGIITLSDVKKYFLSHGHSYKSALRPELLEAFNGIVSTLMKQPREVTVDVEKKKKLLEDRTKSMIYYLTMYRQYLEKGRTWGKKREPSTPEQLKRYDGLVEKIKNGDYGPEVEYPTKERGWRGASVTRKTYQNILEIDKIYKEALGFSQLKKGASLTTATQYVSVLDALKSDIKKLTKDNKVIQEVNTDYYNSAREIDQMRSSTYWSTPHEMMARAFESYVEGKLEEKNQLSQYLVHSTNNKAYANLRPYPEGVEKVRIDEAFDKLFETIQTREEEGGVAMFRIAGEYGARSIEDLIDNLSIAKRMESSRESARTIFLATGWERGKDGLWRHETRDIELKKDIDFISKLKPQDDIFTEEVPITDIVKDEELFNSYPQLKDVKLTFYNYGSEPITETGGFADFKKKVIGIGTKDLAKTKKGNIILQHGYRRISPAVGRRSIYVHDRESLRTELSHEIQHYIQRIEGFAEGGTERYTGMGGEGDMVYPRLAGEVEARNVQRRLGLTPEERRQRMLVETEDIARDQQIVIRDEINRQMNISSGLDAVNQRFNEELDQFLRGKIKAGHTFELGNPSHKLLAAGFPDLPIQLTSAKLKEKSTHEQHPFDPGLLKNLPDSVQNPIAVFRSLVHLGSNVILTEIQDEKGNNFVVVIELEKEVYRGRKSIIINDIRSVYPKDNITDIKKWIVDYKLLDWVDKEKALNWLGRQRTLYAEAAIPIKDITNIINSFENPKVSEGKDYPLFRISDALYFSPTEKALDVIKQEKATPQQWKAMLLKSGAKEAEFTWMGWDELVEGKNSLTKADIQSWIDQNKIEIEEVEKGKGGEYHVTIGGEEGQVIHKDTMVKYAQYALPGAEDYKELLLTMPAQAQNLYKVKLSKDSDARPDQIINGYLAAFGEVMEYTRGEAIKKARMFNGSIELSTKKENYYTSHHWDEPNVLAHVRFNTRTTQDGKNILFIEEIQSDW
ncbi:hypothetical protein JXA85_03825, partial [Candidatus Woesearchaeota archaeon]|nr:hypothetical protein [Candidatus Woesearchaeota archaeon]